MEAQRQNIRVDSARGPQRDPDSQRFQIISKAPSAWRKPVHSNFNKNGNRQGRLNSEQARYQIRNDRQNFSGQVVQRKNNQQIQGQRNQRQPGAQRSKSLNPLIYPDWWGDGDVEESPMNFAAKKRQKQDLLDQQLATEQPRIRNEAHHQIQGYSNNQVFEY